MKANELRIGNYVERNDNTGYEIHIHDLRVLLSNPDQQNYKPITLDEEWLLKFGFKFTKIHKGFNQYRNKGVLELSITPNGFEIFFNYKWIIIEYVHTFQNLHFALTGNELKIK